MLKREPLLAIVGDMLEPGEEIVAAMRCIPEGGVLRMGLTIAASGMAALQSPGVQSSLAAGAILALTERRVFIFSVSGFDPRKPTALVGEFPREWIVDFSEGKKRVMMSPMRTVTFRLDGSANQNEAFDLTFEVSRPANVELDEVLAELRR